MKVSGELTCLRNVNILQYTGKVSTTNSGHDCKMWKDVPNAHDLYFYEAGSAKPERNRCRNINVGSDTVSTIFPGCVNAVTGQYEYCQESICEKGKAVLRFSSPYEKDFPLHHTEIFPAAKTEKLEKNIVFIFVLTALIVGTR